ncbi:hypothetical protein BTR23_17945 [Alkalihalophilus pseudofirmus]|nr:hypothetical protein BTR23_17945 [Alkalihalophilus pseudofirmus]
MSIEEAIQIALQHVPGLVVEVELDMENGFLVYEVEILTPLGIKYEVDVDVMTGRIIEIEID